MGYSGVSRRLCLNKISTLWRLPPDFRARFEPTAYRRNWSPVPSHVCPLDFSGTWSQRLAQGILFSLTHATIVLAYEQQSRFSSGGRIEAVRRVGGRPRCRLVLFLRLLATPTGVDGRPNLAGLEQQIRQLRLGLKGETSLHTPTLSLPELQPMESLRQSIANTSQNHDFES
jgi:hypothetical protein